MNGLFLASTAVSGASFSEDSCAGIYAYQGSLSIPLFLRKRCSWMDFFAVSFVRDIRERNRDADMNSLKFVLKKNLCYLILNHK